MKGLRFLTISWCNEELKLRILHTCMDTLYSVSPKFQNAFKHFAQYISYDE